MWLYSFNQRLIIIRFCPYKYKTPVNSTGKIKQTRVFLFFVLKTAQAGIKIYKNLKFRGYTQTTHRRHPYQNSHFGHFLLLFLFQFYAHTCYLVCNNLLAFSSLIIFSIYSISYSTVIFTVRLVRRLTVTFSYSTCALLLTVF